LECELVASVACPSCGAPLTIKTESSLIIVCGYCDSTLMRQDMNLAMVGKMAKLEDDGSPIQLGTTGTYRGVPFSVIGRIQLEYPSGYWNEWYIDLDDARAGWLGDGQGQYTVTFLVEPTPKLPPFESLKLGHAVEVGAEDFQVTEISQSRCIAGAGELPFSVKSGYDLPVADLSGLGNRFATLDYSETPPLAFVGERMEFDELSLAGLREFEGW
jgi:hypothetical protein